LAGCTPFPRFFFEEGWGGGRSRTSFLVSSHSFWRSVHGVLGVFLSEKLGIRNSTGPQKHSKLRKQFKTA
jgi:hypothetical protein